MSKKYTQKIKRIRYRGRKAGAPARAGKAVQDLQFLNSGIREINISGKESNLPLIKALFSVEEDSKLPQNLTTRALLEDLLTGQEKVQIKVHNEILTDDKDGIDILYQHGEKLREFIAEEEREQKEFEVPRAKGAIVDHDARYFDKLVQIRSDSVAAATLTRALKKAEDNIGLAVTYFPEFRSEAKIRRISQICEYEARNNPADYASHRAEIEEIKTIYEGVIKMVTPQIAIEKLPEVLKEIEKNKLAEIREKLADCVKGMEGGE